MHAPNNVPVRYLDNFYAFMKVIIIHAFLFSLSHTHTQYGVTTSTTQSIPKLMDSLSGKNLQQISAAVRHGAASDSPPPVKGISNLTVPACVPVQYSALRDVPCQSIHARLLLLNHFSKIITTSWRLFSTRSGPKVHY